MSQEKVSELISHIMTAVSNCALYSEEHLIVNEFSKSALKLIEGLYADDSVSFVVLGDSLIFNNIPYSIGGMNITSFLKRLKKKRIDKIVIKKGIDIEEFRKFIVSMASGGEVSSSPHISVGVIEVKFKSDGVDASALMAGGISKVKDIYQEISRFKRLDMVGIEDAVINFISTLKKEMNVLRIVSPVKSHSEYTYVHATNVAVLTIFQAEHLGIKGETLHDIGLAGLLHDVGKMFVSTAVLDKRAGLDVGEWTEMKKHPVYGAYYLSKLPDAPPIAAIAAYEHHMKFDGSGYPEPKRSGKKQHIVSQMVAVSDFFDALRTERPYRKSIDVRTIAGLINEGSGRDFNPSLVENFLSALKKVTDQV